MLRVIKPTSPMSIGTWILSAYAPLNFASAASEVTGIAPALGRAAGLGAGHLGGAVSSYTAALICDTAVPAWHSGYQEMPFVFVGSAASAGSGFALIASPLSENGPARQFGMIGALTEYGSVQILKRRVGPVVREALTAAGALGTAAFAHRSRVGAALSGTALLLGSALARFGLFAAGVDSARDPKYTVLPQRVRLTRAGA